MLSKENFIQVVKDGVHILDGATGSKLIEAGMPRGCCAEEWILLHPDPLIALQREYAAAGSQIIFAPTFQAQPLALERAKLQDKCEEVNSLLARLTRAIAPDCLVAGDITTLAGFCDSWDETNFDLLVGNYRRQIRGLIDGGVDIIGAETLLYPIEAEAIMTAAELENAGAVMYSFTMQPGGSLFSGAQAGPVLRELEKGGAAAVGFNCVAADALTPSLVAKLRRYVKLPLICKPNAGLPTIGENGIAHYSMDAAAFAKVLAESRQMGADLLGGCCGTGPDFIKALQSL